jgi:chromosome partitioning protein
MKAGQRVATIDLDSRQRSLTHYVENRGACGRTGLDLELPAHFAVARAKGARLDQNEIAEFAEFDRVVTAVQHGQDFVVIDTPPRSPIRCATRSCRRSTTVSSTSTCWRRSTR